MKNVSLLFFAFLLVLFYTYPSVLEAKGKQAEGPEFEKRIYKTRHTGEQPPAIDGSVDDDAWDSVPWSGDFTQRRPYDGSKPSQETAIKILYDDRNLYVAVRAFDKEPEKIERRLSRRDRSSGDWVEINIDSLYDKRTAYSFTVSVSGTKGDEAISNNNHHGDRNWNPVWYAKSKVDKKGWTAEMRIPFSQLRFADKDEHIWGLQFTRRFFRKEERSVWQYIPQDSPGWVHLFGELRGLKGIKAQRRIELLPYSVGNVQTFEKEAGNPFATGKSTGFNGGLDGKIGITGDLTLDFTINPDFGQVEADPSEVNLTAFESYFREKRPFFIEGKEILNFQISGGDGGFSRDNLFYSRRIGRAPQGQPDTEDGEFVDKPNNTRILAAAKLTGKTKNGLSIAIMESITAKENAEIDLNGQRRHETVEPFTNYFAMRLQKDYRDGDTRFGGMFTAVNRNIGDKDPQLDFLHRAAYTGGLDFVHNWKNKTYFVFANMVFSHVRGSKESILDTQESSRRYYQRPDADYIEVDPERTSLSGHGGSITIGKEGSGLLRFASGLSWRSPGLELNDTGFLRTADRIMQFVWVGLRQWKPFSIFRNLGLNFNQWQNWNFGGQRLALGTNIRMFSTFKNYWGFGAGVDREFQGLSTTALRGGPALVTSGNWRYWLRLSSDMRKKIRFVGRISQGWGDDNSSRFTSLGGGMVIRPTNALELAIMPSLRNNMRRLQYVSTKETGGDNRYLFATLNQKTLSLTMRLELSITPDLTIQFYGQPFLSAGTYSDFKKITGSRSKAFNERFHRFSGEEIQVDKSGDDYLFDEDLDGVTDYSLGQPNFNFLQFRSNLVVRWEYKPGSTVYLVWSQGRTFDDNRGEFNFGDNFRDLFRATPHNVFLIKFAHRFTI